jgi:hypothetical protein
VSGATGGGNLALMSAEIDRRQLALILGMLGSAHNPSRGQSEIPRAAKPLRSRRIAVAPSLRTYSARVYSVGAGKCSS